MQLSWFHFNPLFSGVFSLGKIIYWKLKCGLLVLHWEVCFCLIIFLWDCIYGNGKKNVIKLVLLHFSKAFVFCIVLEYEEVAWGSQGLEPALPQHRNVWCAFSPSDPCMILIACNWCIYVQWGSPADISSCPGAIGSPSSTVHQLTCSDCGCTCNNGIVHFWFWALSTNEEKGAPFFFLFFSHCWNFSGGF